MMFSPDWVNVYVALAGILLAAVTYILGVRQGRRDRQEDAQLRHEAEDRQRSQARIDTVVGEYLRYDQGRLTSGLHGLLLAGAKLLASEEEVQRALAVIVARTGRDPLAGYRLRAGASARDLIQLAEFDRLKVTNDRVIIERLGPSSS